jgi:hypothetical protein
MTDETILQKIRAMLNRTTANGCTEAEAMTAAAMVAKLMDRYNLSAADVLAGQTEATDDMFQRADHDHPVSFVGKAVAGFTGTQIYCHNGSEIIPTYDLFGGATWERKSIRKLRIVGLVHEVEIAKYVLDICYVAMEASAARALMSENDERQRGCEPLIMGNERKAWVFDFQRGMAARMAETLRDMTAERQRDNSRVADVKGSGRDMAVVRTDLVAKWFSDRGIQLSRGRSSGVKHRSAFGAGQAAGSNVKFHSGVGAVQRGVAAIGSR